MGRKSVAVLDIRSSELTVIVGEKGVNNTFVFKASKTEPYYGYEGGAFYDEGELKEAVLRAVAAVEKATSESLRELYIGVPGEFTAMISKEVNAGFPKKRKIGEREVEALMEKGKTGLKGYRFMRATSTIYVTADNRRVIDPVGLFSTSLDGAFSYFFCSEYFAKTMEEIFEGMKIELRYLPTELAMANYLVPSETRDECALFLDVGYLSSTVSVLLGNGVLAQETFWVGKGQIIFLLLDRFGLGYEEARDLLDRANLYMKAGPNKTEMVLHGKTYEVDLSEVTEIVKEGLDLLCEKVSGFLESYAEVELDYKPLYVSGEGLAEMRGAIEHVSKRLGRVCELIAPDLPYYNKPSMSSRIALIDMAYEDHRKRGFIYRLFNGYGG